MEFDYTVTTTKSFNDAAASVEKEIAAAGMRVLHVHDVQQTFADKGVKRDPFKIIEFCSVKYAKEFLDADIKIGLCMPCKINVYVKDGVVYISGMRPIILPQFFPNAELGDTPKEIDEIVQSIINKAK
jgi:uncharacterized protein (DUF302 family)